jgi:hypothetical protein
MKKKIDWADVGLYVLAGLMVLLVVVMIVGLIVLLTPISCNAQTIGIGLPHSWSLFGGCKVQLHNGSWIPLQNYIINQPQ